MDPLTLAALDAGKVRLDQWIQAAVGIPTEAGSDPFLEATSQLAALLVSHGPAHPFEPDSQQTHYGSPEHDLP